MKREALTLGNLAPSLLVSAFSPTRRLGVLAMGLVAAVTAACGDGPLLSRAVVGYYRLVSVNGQTLPYISPPSLGLSTVVIWRGDLLLRSDGSFMQGMGIGATREGTYRLSGREIVFRAQGAGGEGSDVVGNLSGDSISITSADPLRPLHFVFRRAHLTASSVPSQHYHLTSINGRTAVPLVMYDTVIGDTRYVGRVLFDSLTFLDGIFFRQHRAEEVRGYRAGSEPLIADDEWTTWGAFESGSGWIRLMHYSSSGSAGDSLSIVGDTLVRRTSLITGLQEERYTSR
jgi:hypothetical protein